MRDTITFPLRLRAGPVVPGVGNGGDLPAGAWRESFPDLVVDALNVAEERIATGWEYVGGSPEGQSPPGRSSSHARRYLTAGSIQCQAVAADTKSKAAAPGGCHVSKDASMTSTSGNPARFCLPTAARSAPISTHVI